MALYLGNNKISGHVDLNTSTLEQINSINSNITDLNNKVNALKLPDFIDVGFSAHTAVTPSATWGTGKKAPLNSLWRQSGNKFTFTNNAITVGSGVSMVKVTLSTMLSGSTNTIFPEVIRNRSGYEIAYGNTYINAASSGAWVSCSIITTIDVQAGDVIQLNLGVGTANTTASFAGGQSFTHFIVEEIG